VYILHDSQKFWVHILASLSNLHNTVKLHYSGLGYNGHLVNTDFCWSQLSTSISVGDNSVITLLVQTCIYYRLVSWLTTTDSAGCNRQIMLSVFVWSWWPSCQKSCRKNSRHPVISSWFCEYAGHTLFLRHSGHWRDQMILSLNTLVPVYNS